MKRIISVILLFLFAVSNLYAFDSTQIIFHFKGPTIDAQVGLRLKDVGDINTDGFDDIAVSSNVPFGAYIFYGGNPVDTIPDMFLNGHISAEPIDLDGDGINDIITQYAGGANFGAVYFYKGYKDSLASIPYDSLYFADSNYAFGWYGQTAFVDSDSLGDYLTYQRNTLGGATFYYYSGCPTIDKTPEWTYKIENYLYQIPSSSGFGFIDFNGDNQLDIYIGLKANNDTIGYVGVFYGPNFGSQPDLLIAPPLGYDSLEARNFAIEVENIGDANGDGWDDLGVLYRWYFLIYYGGPTSDSLYDDWMGKSNEFSSAGDINNDGFNDLLSGDSRTFDGVVDIFLGGNLLDTTYDLSIYKSDLPKFALERIGQELSPAGDFNGDGYNDFMFSCRNFDLTANWDVFVIGGSSNIIADVEYLYEPNLPDNFELKQNYPNPFNPSTTIEFQIPRRQFVTLSIYNTLGQKIRTLLSKELSAGSYSLEWDGKNAGGKIVASGVYLYKLDSESFRESKKMVLLK